MQDLALIIAGKPPILKIAESVANVAVANRPVAFAQP